VDSWTVARFRGPSPVAPSGSFCSVPSFHGRDLRGTGTKVPGTGRSPAAAARSTRVVDRSRSEPRSRWSRPNSIGER
jgi:hypothetical protein